jgi:uncharacterized protein (TIGR02646 family)
MIRVRKSTIAPTHLKRGLAATTANCAAFDAESLLFTEGLKSFEFDKTIYGHDSVKKQLAAAQYDKCCYCEDKFRAAASGDVEHFRPKKAIRQAIRHPLEHPGYYWLAYSWSNLFFSCEICNRIGKKSYFPLHDPTKRSRIHSENIENEQPLLLDPGGPEDPRVHIHFDGASANGVTPRGRQTVETINLNRPALREKRLGEANHLLRMREIIAISEANPSPDLAAIADDARTYLLNAVKPDAIFSAMAQDILR